MADYYLIIGPVQLTKEEADIGPDTNILIAPVLSPGQSKSE